MGNNYEFRGTIPANLAALSDKKIQQFLREQEKRYNYAREKFSFFREHLEMPFGNELATRWHNEMDAAAAHIATLTTERWRRIRAGSHLWGQPVRGNEFHIV